MKKILSLILCLATVLGCVSVALASGDTSIVKYESKSTYTVQVPEYIVPDDAGQQDPTEYSVTATNVVLPAGETLSVFVEYSGLVKEENDVSIPYKLYSGSGEITSGAQILSIAAGNPDETSSAQFGAAVTEDAKYSGVYLDTAIFSIKAPKTYTLEEIEANDHMIAVGETKPEYVVAEYNDDYTTVTLFKNGADSDGRMKSFESDPTQNLLAGHEDTLATVNVNDGVVNIGAYTFANMNTLMEMEDMSAEIPYMTPGSDWLYIASKERADEISGVLTTLNVFGDTLRSIDPWAFMLCTKLSTLNLNASLQTIGESAFAITDLSNFSKIPDGVQTIGEAAFAYANMPAIEFGPNIESIGDSAFTGNLFASGNLAFPSSLKTIGSDAFSNCVSMNGNLIFNDGLEEIGSNAFWGCVNLSNSELLIPESVQTIGGDAFIFTFAEAIPTVVVAAENPKYEVVDNQIYEKDTENPVNTGLYEQYNDYRKDAMFENGVGTYKYNTKNRTVLCVDPNAEGTLDLSSFIFDGIGAAWTPTNEVIFMSIMRSNVDTVIVPENETRDSDNTSRRLANFLTLFDRLPNTTVVLKGDYLVKEGDVYKLA